MLGLVVPRKPVDPILDQDQPKLGVFFTVDFEVPILSPNKKLCNKAIRDNTNDEKGKRNIKKMRMSIRANAKDLRRTVGFEDA